MSREKKKGSGGSVKAYISRGKALKKLQLSLTEFRRLCILKGIYPRDPRKKVEGSDKTYYLRKDIDFLAHERLISTIRDGNAHRKKVVKARAKRRLDLLKRLSINAPRAKLDHLIVERYPRFEDALRELDDPLCIIALFANLPTNPQARVTARKISSCQRLLREFCQYVVHTRSLVRAFVSIKGYYFQARVCGVKVTWITPHRFTQHIPNEVDFSVLTTFLELYECMLTFVNFRLYTSRNLAYPPRVDRKAATDALELDSLIMETSSKSEVGLNIAKRRKEAQTPNIKVQVGYDIIKQAEQIAKDAANEEEDDEEADINNANTDNENFKETTGETGENDDDVNDSPKNDIEDGSRAMNIEENIRHSIEEKDLKDVPNQDQEAISDVAKADNSEEEEEVISTAVFFGKSVVLGREVPFFELEFVLKAAGASRVTREDGLVEGENRTSGYTHWIIDRPKIAGDRNMSLEYVQPQYVFDSVNAGLLLPTSLYAPGAHLPPHLSPFVTAADDGGYKPWYEEILERIKKGDASVVDEAAVTVYAEGEAIAKKTSKEVEKHEINRTVKPNGDDVESRSNGVVDNSSGDDGLDSEEGSEAESVDKREQEEDSEGEEERIGKESQEKMDKEAEKMASLLLSQKKLRKYNKVKGKEQRKEAAKRKLMQKRLRLEGETAELTKTTPKKRART